MKSTLAPSPAARGRATALAIAIVSAVAPHAQAGDFRSILVDAETADWGGVSALHTDPAGDAGAAAVDVEGVWVANDDEFVYVRIGLAAEAGLQALSSPLRLYVDGDNSTSTGFLAQGIGSDFVVIFSPSGSGVDLFEQTAGNFQAADLGHAPFGFYHGPTVSDVEFELRLRRDTFLPNQGRAAFDAASFKLALEGLAGGAPSEIVPNVPGTLEYAMAGGTPDAPPDNDLARVDPAHVRILSFNTRNGTLFGSGSAAATRLLQAVDPDVIAFQELWSFSVQDVENRLASDLPLPAGESWRAAKGDRGQITATRWPFAVPAGAPSDELALTIDLPDAEHDRDLHVINSHLKCCGGPGSSQDQQRQASADAIASWIGDLQSPGGAELPENTPIVHLGDMNLVGGPRPLITLLTGDIVDEGTYGPDVTPDWDGTDLTASLPIHADALSAYTWRNDFSPFAPGKLDYLLFTDSVVEVGNAFVLDTREMPPSKLVAHGLQAGDSEDASDHLLLVQDLRPLPETTGAEPGRVAGLRLEAAPNPALAGTRVRYRLPREGAVRLTLHDAAGREVARLFDGERPVGEHAVAWDGRRADGRRAAPGVYWLRLVGSGGTTASARLVVSR